MINKCCGFLLFLCVLASCAPMQKEASDMEIVYQTYHIDPNSITRPSSSFHLEGCTKYHGQYFCLFREDSLRKYGENSYYHLLVIQPTDSAVIEISKTAARLIEYKSDNVFDYPQMFVRNDSLLINGFGAGEGGYNYHCIIDSICGDDGTSCWTLKEILPPSFIVHEDDEYSVKFTNCGYGGQYMSFIGKTDLKEHIYRCWGKVFKRHDGYYLCSNEAVCRIANPKEGLVHSKDTVIYGDTIPTSYWDAPSSNPEILFSPSDPDILMNAFFTHNDSIYLLESYKDSTYLSKFDGQGIIRLKNVEQKVSHIFSSALGKDYVGYGETYNFINHSKDGEGHFGIIDIDGNRMTIVNLLTNQPSGDNHGIDKLTESSKRKNHVLFSPPEFVW